MTASASPPESSRDPFDVPAGVTLCGAGAGATRIVGPSDLPTLTLAPGTAETPTVVTGLTAESVGDLAIRAVGAGYVEVSDAAVAVPTNGAGIGAESLTSVAIRSVTVTGPVNAGNADAMPLTPSITDSATHGMTFVGVSTVIVEESTVTGFAYVGVLSVNSGMTWRGGAITSTLGTNLLVYGGTATIEAANLEEALQGTRLIPAYDAVLAGGADVSTNGVDVSNSGGYGILQSEATATHVGLSAMSNRSAALWVQNSGGFSLSDSNLDDNGMAGVVAYASTDVNLADVVIDGTRSMTRIFGTMPVEVGDGVQLVGSTTNVSLARLGLGDNARVGLLVDLRRGRLRRHHARLD